VEIHDQGVVAGGAGAGDGGGGAGRGVVEGAVLLIEVDDGDGGGGLARVEGGRGGVGDGGVVVVGWVGVELDYVLLVGLGDLG
jgi:hypothetical protein